MEVIEGKKRILPLSKLLPNIITLIGLCCGLSSIRFALDQRWEIAVIFVMIAALADLMDGRFARMLNATSKIGAQLDSLSDFLNFGIAPALINYLWCSKNFPIKGVGWASTLIFSICCAVRLARFNSELDDENKPAWTHYFFIGVPVPAAALLVLTPIMLWLHFDEMAIFANPTFLIVCMILVALLMPSRIPTISTKKLSIPREFAWVFMVGIGLLAASIIIEPWITLPFLAILYVISIPVSAYMASKMRRASAI